MKYALHYKFFLIQFRYIVVSEMLIYHTEQKDMLLRVELA